MGGGGQPHPPHGREYRDFEQRSGWWHAEALEMSSEWGVWPCCAGWLLWLTSFISGPRQREHIPLNWYRTRQAALGVSELPEATGVMYTHRQTLLLYSHRLTQKLNHILGLST